ncbi:MAG: hypothetical protein PHN56_02885 [Candidatus Nanoarchaeia archaeon]|nr:hypothetical protein [Candidatus Nanoarchaeia archaeon]
MFKHKKYLAVMIVCFLLGGFSLILFIISINAGLTFTLSPSIGVFSVIESMLPNGVYLIISSVSFIAIVYSISFIFAGVSIFYLTNEKEKISYASDLSEHLLSDDEKKVINLLKSRGVMTQKEIEKTLNMNKVKLSRVIGRLCNKNFVQKISNGMTNKIILSSQ